jgi:hypothetical protein
LCTQEWRRLKNSVHPVSTQTAISAADFSTYVVFVSREEHKKSRFLRRIFDLRERMEKITYRGSYIIYTLNYSYYEYRASEE